MGLRDKSVLFTADKASSFTSNSRVKYPRGSKFPAQGLEPIGVPGIQAPSGEPNRPPERRFVATLDFSLTQPRPLNGAPGTQRLRFYRVSTASADQQPTLRSRQIYKASSDAIVAPVWSVLFKPSSSNSSLPYPMT
ncbi:hypothetical protein CLAIMM_01917 [Cladophialophora immunda]|nr:hypothetical protein CLAIMM_01917 [Cladophialophora immunda]